MSPELRERLVSAFPYAVAAVLPLAGLVLGLLRLGEGRGREGALYLGAAVLGTLIWLSVLSL